MKTLQFNPTNPETHFTVTKNNINNHNALLPNILYETMEEFAKDIVVNNIELVQTSPKLYQLELYENAFLNDQLKLQSKIKKFNGSELQLAVIVISKNNKNVICKAIFKFRTKDSFSNAC